MNEYALVLADPPVARATHSRAELNGAEARARGQAIRAAQSGVLAELARRHVAVLGASQVLANAVFVRAGRPAAEALRAIPGVARVQYLAPMKRDLNTATGLINLAAAYTAVGGASSAGAGIRIGIVDTGIDQNHAGFQDSSLTPPAGFPRGDPNYTNNKVIVARSYVSLLNSGNASDSSPDDTSPADRFGHGTSIAMIAAGLQNTGPLAAIQGVAPKAFLGNYKIFGSPGVNDFAHYSAISQALEDALADGMDIVTLALHEGDGATDGPLDYDNGANGCGGYCDVRAEAVENAVANGMVVVASAGNDGASGRQTPTLSTIHSPGTAPSAITVGATSNAHILYQSVSLFNPGGTLLQSFPALFADGPRIAARLRGPLVDVATLGNDGQACTALPAGSLAGSIALVQRGGACFSDAKINNAQAAGAIAVVLCQSAAQGDTITSTLYVSNTGIPALDVGYTNGVAITGAVGRTPGIAAVLDPAVGASPIQQNVVAAFSSRGPSLGLFANTPVWAIKPELVAPGDGIYTATQTLDPNGDGYNASGYTVASGTSYAVGFVAGAVAVVKQHNPALTPAQLKSAVVDTATQDVSEPSGAAARMNSTGAGKLSVGDAVAAAAAVAPPTVAFGPVLSGALPIRRTLTVSNTGSATATFSLAVQARDAASAAVTVSPSTLTLAAGAQSGVTVTLAGSQPPAGEYEGFLAVTGAGSTLRVPYQFLVPSGAAADIIPVTNGGFLVGAGDSAAQGKAVYLSFRLLDGYGVPIVNAPALYAATQGGGSIYYGDLQTYRYGLAAAQVNMGSSPGEQIFTGTAQGLTYAFDGYARQYPAIASGGVVNTASYTAGQGLAPGSYVSIFGNALADSTELYGTAALPVSLASVSVSFDDGGLSLPGHLSYVSPTQVNVQIPWEFQGHSSVRMKVAMSYLFSNVYTLNLAQYSPGLFANSGNAAVVDWNTSSVVSIASPAHRGDLVELYLNGLGPVSNTPASGAAAPAAGPLSNTATLPTVTIGGVNAPVSFSGLAPGFVGLYQVNALVPAGAPTGLQPVVVSIGGVASPAAGLPVQ